MEKKTYSQRELPVQRLRDISSSKCVRNHKVAQGPETDELRETKEEAAIIWYWRTLKDFGFSLSDIGSTGQSLIVLGPGQEDKEKFIVTTLTLPLVHPISLGMCAGPIHFILGKIDKEESLTEEEVIWDHWVRELLVKVLKLQWIRGWGKRRNLAFFSALEIAVN